MKPILRLNFGVKLLLFVLISPLMLVKSFAQITSFPKNYQLYPRNTGNNKATIVVAGTISYTLGYDEISLKIFRNDVLKVTARVKNNKSDKTGFKFSIKTEIIAELANYTYSLYGYKGTTETLITSADHVVAGDAFIIQGQSNAIANLRGNSFADGNVNDPLNSPYREFVRVYGNGSATSSYTKAWFVADGNLWYELDGNIGQWGLRMASNIAAEKKIPIAVLNGASPGAPINYFLRNNGNAFDLSTNYGRLLSRADEAGLKNDIRGVIWHQGESDVTGVLSNTQLSTEDYKKHFLQLAKAWRDDFKGLEHIYLFQIRFGCGMASADSCLRIQEAQRQLGEASRDLTTISTGNTFQLNDGGAINYCHYNFNDGYKNMGDWVSRLMLRDIYRRYDRQTVIESPAPESALFSGVGIDGAANQVRLALKDQSSLLTLQGDLSPLFRLDGGNYLVKNVSLSSNNLLINFERAADTRGNPSGVSFRGHDQLAAPVLINGGGLALLNFEKFPIQPLAPVSPCMAAFEPNNYMFFAKYINTDQTYMAAVGSLFDVDWYRFKTTSQYPFVKASLWNLPADYDLYMYNSKGNLLGSSTSAGTTAETIQFNTAIAGNTGNNGSNDLKFADENSYWLKVVAKNFFSYNSSCYAIRVQAANAAWPADAPPYAIGENANIQKQEPPKTNLLGAGRVTTYPNPVQQTLMVNYAADNAATVDLRIVDLNGKERILKSVNARAGINQFELNVSGLNTGLFILQIRKDAKIITTKFVVGPKQ
jgi:Carbohydrate esterase, sialic acid-specific acetylesterase/Secretion system C-terminal sorting domain